MSKLTISIIILLITIILIMFLFSKPNFYIESYKENNNSLVLNVYSKFKKCGTININSENITYQYSIGLHGKKGLIDLKDVILNYGEETLFIKIKNNKDVISIKCNQETYDKITIYFNNKLKILEDPSFKSKRDLFFGD